MPPGNKLGGVTGGTATGEVMTQDQFGTNYDQLGPLGSPFFYNAHTNILDLVDTGSGINHLRITTPDERTTARILTLSIGDANRSLTISGDPVLVSGTMAPTSGKLSQFAATTSAELAGVISDETGSGSLVFAVAPTLNNAIINQAANGDTAIKSIRATDTSPTGNFLDFQTAALSSIFTIDRYGKQTVNLTAQTSTAEVLAVWQVSDSSSKFQVTNGTANASEFAPVFEGVIEATKVSTALSFFGTKGANDNTNPAILFLTRYNSGSGNTDLASATCMAEFRNRATTILQVFPVSLTFKDAFDLVVGTSTGTKIGTSTSQKLSLWNKTPIVQPTTSITGATFVANSGTTVNDASTFGGYTLKQLAAAMVNFGLVA